MFDKRVSQSERRIRNSHVISMRTRTPLGSNFNYQVYMLALESARTPKAHDNRSELRKNVIVLNQQCQEIPDPLSGGRT